MSTQYGFSFDSEKCIQCHGCQAACKSWREVEILVNWRRLENIWHGDYPNVTCFSASLACMHCADPPCVEACPEEAIEKRVEDGVVVVDRDKCTGCRACLEACPFDVPQFGRDDKMQKCDLCVNEIDLGRMEQPPCVETCPTGTLRVVRMSRPEKIAAEESMKKLLNIR